MNKVWFCRSVAFFGLLFVFLFCVVVIPAFIQSPDVIAAFAAGFVNPFAAGYSIDTMVCWCLLAVRVLYEAKQKGIKHGWLALVLGVVPGVAAGLAIYLLIRERSQA